MFAQFVCPLQFQSSSLFFSNFQPQENFLVFFYFSRAEISKTFRFFFVLFIDCLICLFCGLGQFSLFFARKSFFNEKTGVRDNFFSMFSLPFTRQVNVNV